MTGLLQQKTGAEDHWDRIRESLPPISEMFPLQNARSSAPGESEGALCDDGGPRCDDGVCDKWCALRSVREGRNRARRAIALSASPPTAPAGEAGMRAEVECERLREALREAKVWHERRDKELSKSGRADADYYWRRDQHRDQIEDIDRVLAGDPALAQETSNG